MAELHLPRTLTPLFPDLPRKVEIDAPTVNAAIDELEARWPGVRDRLCELGRREIRPHIHFYVDRERAALDTPLAPASRVDVVAAISGG
jgi:molybdopterin converting factor small subunit